MLIQNVLGFSNITEATLEISLVCELIDNSLSKITQRANSFRAILFQNISLQYIFTLHMQLLIAKA